MSMRAWIRRWRHPLSWAAALVFLALIDFVFTRSPLLWARTSFEDDVGPRMVFAQAYQVARKLYAPLPDADLHVVVVGNSRMWTGLRERPLAAALEQFAEHRSVRVDNLSVFGSGPGVMEVIVRHLARLEPDLVVVGLSGSDLQMPTSHWRESPVVKLMQRGLADPPHTPATWGKRLDRWLRSIWPLYRFREFSRAALVDRVAPSGTGRVVPEHFDSRRQLFDFMRPGLGEEMEAGYRRFSARPCLATFVDYVSIGQADHLKAVRQRAQRSRDPEEERVNRTAVDAMLAQLASRAARTIVLLMPENPLLREDVNREYRQPEVSRDGVRQIRALAELYAVPLIDGRDWMPAQSFLDLDHVMPDVGGLERRLAPEILRAVGTEPADLPSDEGSLRQ
jgi:hypothetical protein